MVTTKKHSKIISVLVSLFLLVTIFMMVGCDGKSTTPSKFTVYNTKNMTDSQITSYFSEKVLQDVKADTRNRTIVIYKVDDSISSDVDIMWSLSNESGEVLNSNAETGIYVDSDAPESEIRIVKIMIGWDETDLDKEWTVNIYYLDEEAKINLGAVSFEVTSSEYIK